MVNHVSRRTAKVFALGIAIAGGGIPQSIRGDELSPFFGQRFEAGGGIASLALADLNNDGFMDVAAADAARGEIVVLLGDGCGAFGDPVAIEVQGLPVDLAIGDFNKDGYQDIAAVSVVLDRVSILLNDGFGLFSDPISFSAGDVPAFIITADLDQDLNLDLVVSNSISDDLTFHWGLGNGLFVPGVPIHVGNNPNSIAAADFDQDGLLDLVVALRRGGAVAVINNSGARNFRTPIEYEVGGFPDDVCLEDFDLDGRTDIATANRADRSVSILFGLDSGAFARAIEIDGFEYEPRSVIASDFDQNGEVDLAVTEGAVGRVAFVLNPFSVKGDPVRFDVPAGIGPEYAQIADLDLDGWPDLIATSNNHISVFLGPGSDHSGRTRAFEVDMRPGSIGIGNFDQDDLEDIVSVRTSSLVSESDFQILKSMGDGTLQVAQTINLDVSLAGELVVADFTGDGVSDVMMSSFDGVSPLVLGPFGALPAMIELRLIPTGIASRDLAVGDLNEDGKTDVVLARASQGGIALLIGQGEGNFTPSLLIEVANREGVIAISDVTGDGHEDVLFAERGPCGVGEPCGDPRIHILKGDGKSGLDADAILPLPADPISIIAADVDRDGLNDILVTLRDDSLHVFFNSDEGFLDSQMLDVDGEVHHFEVADLNEDGESDLIVALYDRGSVDLYFGDGTGWFRNRQSYNAGLRPVSFGFADFNQDGFDDLVVGAETDSRIWMLPRQSNFDSCLSDLDHNDVVNGADLASLLSSWGKSGGRADLNGDGVVNGADLAALLSAWGPCQEN